MTITAQFPPTLLHTGNYNLKYIYCRHYHQSVLCSPLRNQVDPVRELSDDISVINHARNLAKQATPMGLGAKLGRVLALSKEKEREKERERERERKSVYELNNIITTVTSYRRRHLSLLATANRAARQSGFRNLLHYSRIHSSRQFAGARRCIMSGCTPW